MSPRLSSSYHPGGSQISESPSKPSSKPLSVLLSELKECSNTRSLQRGRNIHREAITSGRVSNAFLSNSLINMYAKCWSIGEALGLFEGMIELTTASWNSLLLGFVEIHRENQGLELFHTMQLEGFIPDSRTFVAAIKACTSQSKKQEEETFPALETGMRIHSQAVDAGLELDLFVGSTLVDMYSSFGFMTNAREVFERLPELSEVSWNSLLLGYAENGEEDEALLCFQQMPRLGFSPNAQTFLAALKSCAGLAGKKKGNELLVVLEKVMAIHSLAGKGNLVNLSVYLGNSLIDVYGKCGSLLDARRVFDKMPRRSLVSWNTLMLAYAENGDGEIALELLSKMKEVDGLEPNSRSFVATVKACASLELELGFAVHSLAAEAGFSSDMFVATSLVNMYSKLGRPGDARRVFDGMSSRNLVAWNALILGYAENGDPESSFQVFWRMQEEVNFSPDSHTTLALLKACGKATVKEEGLRLKTGKLVKMKALEKCMAIHSQLGDETIRGNSFIANTLIETYTSCGSFTDAFDLFASFPSSSEVFWTVILSSCAECNEGDAALELYGAMKTRGVHPTSFSVAAAIRALAGDLKAIKALQGEAYRYTDCESSVLLNSLVHSFGECGEVASAQLVFDSMSFMDLASWTSLMVAYGEQGEIHRVLELFHRLREAELQPDSRVFLCVLSACSHAGEFQMGKRLFHSMSSEYGVSPGVEHYHCMIDILGRANQLDEALVLLHRMPFSASAVSWRTILGACIRWKNTTLGKLAFQSLLERDPGDAAAYTMMSNACKFISEPGRTQTTRFININLVL